MIIPSKKLIDTVLGKDCTLIKDNIPKHLSSDNTIFYYVKDEVGVMHNINIYELMYKMKDWICQHNTGQGLSTHKLFYTQTNGREWYAGYAKIKTNYDDKCTLKDLSKGKTEFEAVVTMLEDIIKGD